MKKMKPGNFVCAGLPSISSHINSVLKYQSQHLNPEQCNDFLVSNCDKFLSSVGIAIGKGRINSKVISRYQKMFNKFLSYKFLKNCEIFIDSAGYQFQSGKIFKEDTVLWMDLYHDFLEKNEKDFAYAFLFDPVPGATGTVLSSYQEMEKFNVLSYTKASNLSEKLRDKMFYIHHFRTPQIRRLFKKLINDYKFADNFRNFSTGGLVSFGGQGRFPVVMYTIPLTDIIEYVKKRGLKKFRYHVLGATEFKDIIFHRIIEYHVKKVHNIDINITYDSSTVHQSLMMARYIYVMDENSNLCKLSLRGEHLKLKWRNSGLTHEEVLFNLIHTISDDYNFPRLDSVKDPVYPTGSVLHQTHYVYGIFLILKAFNEINDWATKIIEEIYPFYESNDHLRFSRKMEKTMIQLNGGKPTKGVDSRTIAIFNSLKLIESLDIDYCDHLVKTYFAGDENHKLAGKEVCTFI